MTLEELYANIDGDYSQAMRVLRVDRLLDKHIRKLANNGVIDQLIEAGKNKDSKQMFEAAHAVKGICGNLGLTRLAKSASVIAEEYRPGKERTLTDDEVQQELDSLAEQYQKTKDGIDAYVAQ